MMPEFVFLWKLALIFVSGVFFFLLAGQGVLALLGRLGICKPTVEKSFFGISETFLTGSLFSLIFTYLLYQTGRHLGIEHPFRTATIAGLIAVLIFAVWGFVSIFPKRKELPRQLKPLLVILLSSGFYTLPMLIFPGLQFTAFEGTDAFGYIGTAQAMQEDWYHLPPNTNTKSTKIVPTFLGNGEDPVTEELVESAAYRPSRAWTYRMMFSGERPLTFFSTALVSTWSGLHPYQGYWLTGAWILGLYGAAIEFLWRLWKKEPLSFGTLLAIGLFSAPLSGMLGNLDRQYLGHTWGNLVLLTFPLGIFAFPFQGKKNLACISSLLFLFYMALWAIYDTRYALFGLGAFLATAFLHARENRLQFTLTLVLISAASFVAGAFFLGKGGELVDVLKSPASFGKTIIPGSGFLDLLANDLHLSRKGTMAPVMESLSLIAGIAALLYATYSFWKRTDPPLPARMHTYLALLWLMFMLMAAKFLRAEYFPGVYKCVFGACAILVPLLVCSFLRPTTSRFSFRKMAFAGAFLLLGVSSIWGTLTFAQRITRQVQINIINGDLGKLSAELSRLNAQGVYLDVNDNPAQLLLLLYFLPENQYGFGVPYGPWLKGPGLLTKDTEVFYKAVNARILARNPNRLFLVRRVTTPSPSWEIKPISIGEWNTRVQSSLDEYKKQNPSNH